MEICIFPGDQEGVLAIIIAINIWGYFLNKNQYFLLYFLEIAFLTLGFKLY